MTEDLKEMPQRGALAELSFGLRLRAARMMAGLSMEDLARRLGGVVTKQAIGKYEKGRMMPSSEVRERLVQVLHEATGGASPLSLDGTAPTDKLADVARGIDLAEMTSPLMARRAGLLSRLMAKRPQIDTRHEIDGLFRMESPLNPSEALPDHGQARAADTKIVSIAERRNRYAEAWLSAPVATEEPLEQVRFREGRRLAAKTEIALKYRIADYLRKYLELESVMGSTAAFENPASGLPVRTADDVERAADEVRRGWRLGAGPIVNLLGLLEDRGVKVYEARGIEDFDGLSGRFGAVAFVAVSLDYPADRVRFTAAHELGHILGEFSAEESPEGLCHAFAAALLLPRAALERAFGPARRRVSLGELGDLKEEYGISLQAIMYRAHSLGFVSDRQLRSFRETARAEGWLAAEPVLYKGKESAAGYRRLLRRAVAANILEVERAAALAGVSAEEMKKEIGEIF